MEQNVFLRLQLVVEGVTEKATTYNAIEFNLQQKQLF